MKTTTVTFYLLATLLISSCSDSKEGSTKVTPTPQKMPVLVKTVLFPAIPPALGKNPFVPGGMCFIDLVNKSKPEKNIFTIHHASELIVSGWALDNQKQSVPTIVVLKLVSGKQSYHALLTRRDGRKGLAKIFGKPEYFSAGYAGQIDISVLPLGKYNIQIIQASDGKNLVCQTNRKLIVS